MACGTPVVAFKRGSMSELIENNRTGFLVSTVGEAKDAVARIAEIERKCCRHHVEQHFTVERMVGDYSEVYQLIIEMTNNVNR